MSYELGEKTKIKTFSDLDAWKEAHILVINIYKITKNFPKEEMFALVNQMRRCSISITSNIAEGFSRQSLKEKVQFYSMSLGSVTELQSQLLISCDVGYINDNDNKDLMEQSVKVHRILNGLIRTTKNLLNHNS